MRIDSIIPAQVSSGQSVIIQGEGLRHRDEGVLRRARDFVRG